MVSYIIAALVIAYAVFVVMRKIKNRKGCGCGCTGACSGCRLYREKDIK